MANGKYININYPFKNSPKGFFLDLNADDNSAIKADLMHLILTRKGQRLYNPDFGTDLLRFIFQPEDGLTFSQIKDEITTVVKRYLPKLNITDVLVEESIENEYAATVRIDYTITDDVFTTSDFVIIQI
jgi:phage baseplate assembly protein W